MRRLPALALVVALGLLAAPGGHEGAVGAGPPPPPPPPAASAPQLRLALVARDTAGAFAIVRLSGDLPRRADGSVRATLTVAGRATGRLVSLDLVSFRHYCFRAALRRPWPAVGRRVTVALRAPGLGRGLRTSTLVRRARGHDRIGARLGCRLPSSGTA